MRYIRQYKSTLLPVVLAAVTACSSYKELYVNSRTVLPGDSSGFKIVDTGGSQKSGSGTVRQKSLFYTSKKYLACGKGFTPESKIMDMGVEEAVRGNYAESEILFEQVREIISDGSVENNIAVIYELTKRKKDAMILYSRALIISPENSKFRSNLLSFINDNKFIMNN